MPVGHPPGCAAVAARPARWIGTAVLPLGGCVAGPADAGSPWLLAVGALALLLVAALGYALGRLIERQQRRAELQQAREALRLAEQLQPHATWTTDVQHRLQSWQPSGDPPAAAAPGCFEQPALAAQLASRRAFAEVRVLAVPGKDARAWAFTGLPRHDDQGRFSGFAGTAQALDGADRQQLAALALAVALETHDGAAIWATDSGDGWRVVQCNASARELLPADALGAPVAQALAPWPELAAALQAPTLPGQCQGWRLQPVQASGLSLQGLLLSHAASEAAAGPGEASSFTLAHDLRAPIRVIEGFARILKEDFGSLLGRVGHDHIDRVLGAAARMNSMIDAMLTLARLSEQPLQRQRVNLSQLAGFVIDDLRRAAPDRVVELDLQAGLTAWGDPTLLRLVLENLLGNAWKYTGRCNPAQIAFRSVQQGGRQAFVVTDNGAGFDMRHADRLFGLFQRLHSASEFAGHGVGLASVRRIVRRHGGEVWAESEPGRGAAFYFTLGA